MDKTRKIVFYASLAVIAATVLFLIRYYYVRAHEADIYDELQAAVYAEPALEDAASTEAPAATPEPRPCPIDFAQLQAQTPDIYAWIEIPGMDISYPVVQRPSDNSFYLKHDIEGKYNDHGAIYSEALVNATDFPNYHVVLYGHNFEDGTMFSNLTEYRDSDVLEKNRDIFVYTPQEELHYRIFAAVTFNNTYLPYAYDSRSVEARQAFLDALPGAVRDLNNHVLDDVTVTDEDKLLILSTCTGDVDRVIHRYLVVAVLEEQTQWAQGDAG